MAMTAAIKTHVGVEVVNLAWQQSKKGVHRKPAVHGEGAKCLKSRHRGTCRRSLCCGKRGHGGCLNDITGRQWVADSNNVWGHATCGVWDQGQESAGGCHRKAATGKLVTPTEDLEDIGKANCGSNFGSHKAGSKQLPHDPVSYVGL